MRRGGAVNNNNGSADLLFSSDLLAASYLDSDGPLMVPMSTTIGPRSVEPSDDENESSAQEDELLAQYRTYIGGVDNRPDWMCLKTFASGHVVAFATDSDGSCALLAVLKEALSTIWVHMSASSKAVGDCGDSLSSTHPPRRSATETDGVKLQFELRALAATTPQLEAGPGRDLVIKQLQAVLMQLQHHLCQHSLNAISSRIVQFFVDTHFAPFLITIVKGLQGHCFQMAKSGTGSRILRSLLEFCGDHITDDADDEDDNDDCSILNTTVSVVVATVNLVEELDSEDSHSGDSYVHKCVQDLNAHHVLRYALKTIPDYIGVFMATRLSERFLEFAVHPYGARVIQSLFEEVKYPRVSFATEQAALRLMVQAFRNTKTLIHSQNGHIVLSVAISNAPSSPENECFVQSGIQTIGLDFSSIPTVVCGTFGPGFRPIDRLVVAEFGVNAALLDMLANARNKSGSHVLQCALDSACIDTLCAVAEKLLHPTASSLSQILGLDTTNSSTTNHPPPNNNNNTNIKKKKKSTTTSTDSNIAAVLKDSLGGLTPQDASVIPEFGALLFDYFGNHVIQTLYARLPAESQGMVLGALDPFIPMLLHSHHGSAFIKRVAPEKSASFFQNQLSASSLRVGIAGGAGGIAGGVGAIRNSLHSSPRGGCSSGGSPSPSGSFVENRRGQVFNEFIENSRYDQKVPVHFDDIPPPPEHGADYNSDDGWDLRLPKRRSSATTSAGNTSWGLGATGKFSRSDSNVNNNVNTTNDDDIELQIAVLKQRHQNELLQQQIQFQNVLLQQQQQFLMNAVSTMGPMGVNYFANMMMILQQQQQAFMGGGDMYFNNMGMNCNNNNNQANNTNGNNNQGNNNMFAYGNVMSTQPHPPFANQQHQQHLPPGNDNDQNVQTATDTQQHQQQHTQDYGTVSDGRRVSTESLTVFSCWVNQEPTPHKGAADAPDADATATTLPTTVGGDSLTCNPRSTLNFKLPPSTHPTGLYFNGFAAEGVDSDGGSTPATFQSIAPVCANTSDSGDGAVHPLSEGLASPSQEQVQRRNRRRQGGSSGNRCVDDDAIITSTTTLSSSNIRQHQHHHQPHNQHLRQQNHGEENENDNSVASSVEFEFSWRSDGNDDDSDGDTSSS